MKADMMNGNMGPVAINSGGIVVLPNKSVSTEKLGDDVFEAVDNKIADERAERINEDNDLKNKIETKADKETWSGGFAGGRDAQAYDGGGAVGSGAYSGEGFAGGKGAWACGLETDYETGSFFQIPIDSIQLGGGVNSEPKTLQVYTYRMMNADGTIPPERIKKGSINEYKLSTALLDEIRDKATKEDLEILEDHFRASAASDARCLSLLSCDYTIEGVVDGVTEKFVIRHLTGCGAVKYCIFAGDSPMTSTPVSISESTVSAAGAFEGSNITVRFYDANGTHLYTVRPDTENMFTADWGGIIKTGRFTDNVVISGIETKADKTELEAETSARKAADEQILETKADKTELEAETSAREAADEQILETISAMSSGGMKFKAIEIAAGETYELEPNSLYFADPKSTNLNLLSASDNKIVSDNMGVAVIFCADTTDGTTWKGWCAWQSESVLKIADSLPYTFTKGAKIKNIHSTDNAYVYRLYMKGISSASIEGMGDVSELKTSSKTLVGAINEVYNRTLDLYERVSELDIAINGGATVKPIDPIDPIETPVEK